MIYAGLAKRHSTGHKRPFAEMGVVWKFPVQFGGPVTLPVDPRDTEAMEGMRRCERRAGTHTPGFHGLSFVPVASQDGGDQSSRQTQKVQPNDTSRGAFIEPSPRMTGGEASPKLGATSPTRRNSTREVAVNVLDGSGDARGAWEYLSVSESVKVPVKVKVSSQFNNGETKWDDYRSLW